jgi:hypothetical protein
MNVVTCDWDCNKPINNPNGVFSGVTVQLVVRTGQEPRNVVQYINKIMFRLALEPTQPSTIHWVTRAISPEVKRQGREADHSPSSRAEIKNSGASACLSVSCCFLDTTRICSMNFALVYELIFVE